MKKKYLKLLSLLCFAFGIFFILNSKTGVIGAVIGASNISSGFSLGFGVVLVLVGLSLLIIQSSASIDDLVEDIHEVIDEQKAKYKANPRFVKGLKEIERSVNDDKDSYYRTSGHGKNESHLRKAILSRLKRRKEGLKRREEYFFQLPHHAKRDSKTHETTIIDLPDKGLYEYDPMGGKKSRFIELEVTHYTDDKGYKGINKHFRNEEDVILQDTNFGAYFVSKPLEKGLKMKKARQILGIGKQAYASKERQRIPKYELSTKLRVRKERALVKSSYYNRETGGEISEEDYKLLREEEKTRYFPVKKYAIAGGISRKDIVDDIQVERYHHKDIDKETDRNKYMKERWKKSV